MAGPGWGSLEEPELEKAADLDFGDHAFNVNAVREESGMRIPGRGYPGENAPRMMKTGLYEGYSQPGSFTGC